MSTRVSRHCYQASTNQLLSHYDVYNIYSLYSLYKDFQGLLMKCRMLGGTAQMTQVWLRFREYKVLLPVVQVSMWCVTLYRCPLGLGTRLSLIAKATHRCSMLSNATGEPLQLDGIWQRKGLRTLPHHAKLCKMVLLCLE